MDFNVIYDHLKNGLTPTNIVLAILLITTTVLAENPGIKANSLFGLFKTLVFTFKDQVWPQATPTVVVAPVTTDTTKTSS